MAATCLDRGMAGERFDARACWPVSGCALPCCPAVRVGAFFLSGKPENYIAVELRKPLEACATIWPVVEPDSFPQPATGRGWRRTLAGGALLSAFLHASVVAFAIGFLPAATELPAGSEVALPVEILDEAMFAALQEGTVEGPVFPTIPLPDPIEPASVPQNLASASAAVVAPAPDADVPLPEVAPPVDMALLLPAEASRTAEAEKQRPPVEKVDRKPLKRKSRKVPPAKGSETAARAPGRQGTGADAVSTASAVRGKGSRTEGMAGAAANANLRSRIIAHLGRHKRYPDAALAMRLQGSVVLTFSIDPDGSLKSATVSTSSGHGLLDREALAMLRRAQPFPFPPAAEGGRGITVTTRIGYVYPR